MLVAPSEKLEAVVPNGELIAIVEDDLPLRESLRRLMRSVGYTAEVFSLARDFLASPRLDETACLIGDICMPSMTGLELYQKLVETGRPIPTILITAYPDDAVRTRALSEGVICYLQKPFHENDLMRCVSKALERGNGREDNP